MIEAVPPQLPLIVVQNVANHQPTFLLGFMAVGDEQAMSRLESASASKGFSSGRTSNDKNQTEVMILFPPNSDKSAALTLYQEALVGKFGRLVLEVTIAGVSALADGKLDTETEISVEPAATIQVPNR